jgi:pimeloyl-ACP methyl ester carboxylesterase
LHFVAFEEQPHRTRRNLGQISWEANAVNCITRRTLLVVGLAISFIPALALGENAIPKAPGKLVDLGGHQLHVHCSGTGKPTVVVETGLGDFSFDWTLVQRDVSRFTRICTYDRAGYAWSGPGPKPRTFAQINLELHDALQKLGESGPFVLVGHSYGGPAMINFAAVYPQDAAGMVLVDSAHEGMRIAVGGKQTVRLGEAAQIRDIPSPREEMAATDKFTPPADDPPPPMKLEAVYKTLPTAEQKLHLWAQSLPAMEDAENSQREWSEVYFAQWLAKPRDGLLGQIPLIVLTREDGGYTENLDVPAAQMEQERKDGQAKLVKLSSNSTQVMIRSGHNMDLEAPAAVSYAIHRVVNVVRVHQPL